MKFPLLKPQKPGFIPWCCLSVVLLITRSTLGPPRRTASLHRKIKGKSLRITVVFIGTSQVFSLFLFHLISVSAFLSNNFHRNRPGGVKIEGISRGSNMRPSQVLKPTVSGIPYLQNLPQTNIIAKPSAMALHRLAMNLASDQLWPQIHGTPGSQFLLPSGYLT